MVSTLYVTEQGSCVKKQHRRLRVEKQGDLLIEVPAFKVKRIALLGNVQLTTQVMIFVLHNDIDVGLFSSRGRYRGRLVSMESGNSELRIRQYERVRDQEFAVSIARKVVSAKVNNCKVLVSRYQRNYGVGSDKIRQLTLLLKDVDRQDCIESVMGFEGKAAAVYFEALEKMFRKTEFKGRNRRPPLDPVNASLSLGYAFLVNEIVGAVCVSGLDPYLGFLHGLRYGRQSLALDIVEPFRSVVDSLVLHLFNRGMLTDDDFIKEQGVRFTDKGLKLFCREYEQKVTGKDRNGVSLRKLFLDQAVGLRREISGEGEYVPYRI